jgi:uncharacterized membrane protein (UPF0127 family)
LNESARVAPARCIKSTPTLSPPIPTAAPAALCPRDPEAGGPTLRRAAVGFPDAPGSPDVDVELALGESEVTRGLMYRRLMPEQQGMLFRLDERREHTFWMRNTCISLDMLFVDEDGVVVGIVEGAEPLTDAPRTVGCASRFVIEVNAGWCRRHGVVAGQHVRLPASL